MIPNYLQIEQDAVREIENYIATNPTQTYKRKVLMTTVEDIGTVIKLARDYRDKGWKTSWKLENGSTSTYYLYFKL